MTTSKIEKHGKKNKASRNGGVRNDDTKTAYAEQRMLNNGR